MSAEEPDCDLAGPELAREAAQAFFVARSRRPECELLPKSRRQQLLDPEGSLIVHAMVIGPKPHFRLEDFVRLRLHADKQTAAFALPALPPLDQIVDQFPAAKVEIANAEVRPMGDPHRLPQRGQHT